MRHHEFLHRRSIRFAISRAFGSPTAYQAWLDAENRRRRGKDKGKDSGGVPVEPDRPNTLSGGAAAPLEFDAD